MLRFILISIVIIGLGIGKQYITVYYGVPQWEESKDFLLCATENRSLWVSTHCIPHIEHWEEQYLPNVKENFTRKVADNQIIQQAWTGVTSMIDTILKPCVKITPYCVKMTCTPGAPDSNNTKDFNPCEISTGAPTISTISAAPTTSTISAGTRTPAMPVDNNCTTVNTSEINHVCRFNTTGMCKDCRIEIKESFRGDDVVCNKNGTECYVNHCNESVIKQDCQKGWQDEQYVRMCAPPGSVLLKCNEPLNSSKLCENVSAVLCTDMMTATISSFFGFNGTRYKKGELVEIIGNINHRPHEGTGAFVYKVPSRYKVEIECNRKGNRSVVSVNSASGLIYYAGLEPHRNIRKGLCKFKGLWGHMLYDLGKNLQEYNNTWVNYTEDCNQKNDSREFAKCIKQFQIRNFTRKGADRATENIMMICGGEMFFCNITKIADAWNNKNESKWYPWSPCTIRNIVDDWAHVGVKVYLPPVSGFRNHIRCTQRVTEILFNWENKQVEFQAPSNIQNSFVAVGQKYKLVRLKMIGLAPGDGRRVTPKEHHREKRGAIVLGILGFLGLAGSAMGTVSTVLTIQSQHLLAGILQQQKNLLELVEKQQELLRLTIWGVKNLQARLSAIEGFLEDQLKLKQWGCELTQVCHTNVPWNESWNATPNWNNETWQHWYRRTDELQANISVLLVEAHNTEQKNMFELQKLQDWTTWGSWLQWFNIWNWLKWGLLIIGIVVGIRILGWLMTSIRIARQGYSKLISQQSHLNNLEEGLPDREEEAEEDNSTLDVSDWQFKKESAITLLNSLINFLSAVCQTLLQIVWSLLACLFWWIQHGWNLLKRISGAAHACIRKKITKSRKETTEKEISENSNRETTGSSRVWKLITRLCSSLNKSRRRLF
ncbi:env protein [Simian immunodeficiency virus]|uniref:Envelope glycoprotein gp160 n=1 Tax=Simian immunodeficiency virus TaxID=11723 RepID=B7FCA6_SIV|nr:envelope glycoprotein [synthetic construct]CAN86230.1 env protein [Simian immunodeficiency virus]